MTTMAVRISACEAAVAKLASARQPKVSTFLRQARARVQAGEHPTPPLLNVAELEALARRPGVAGAMAKARLRVLRWPQGAPLPPYLRQDANRSIGPGGDPASADDSRSAGTGGALASISPEAARAALVQRIDGI